MDSSFSTLGLIGLGEMGAPIARNLVHAGFRTYGFDLSSKRMDACITDGVIPAASTPDLVARCDIILTSLPSSEAFVSVAENEILPNTSPGQVLIDLGTVTPPETRRLGALFSARGVDVLDVPVSGGAYGAEHASLYMFVGGEKQVFERVRPLLEAIGGPDRITYCGPGGNGQVVKGVNQLMMGLASAAYLEAMSFGVNAGVQAAVIHQAIGSDGRWRTDFHAVSGMVETGCGNEVGVKFRELPYFLRAAQEHGFSLPLTEALYNFCAAGDRIVNDDHRPAPSFWHELTKTY
jgi:3-hydroxyisobutyrate dehydrogenase